MSEKKYYVVGTTTPEAWETVHEILTQDGTLEDNIPTRAIECTDLKEHSPTRAVYLMTDEEAAQLSNHPDISFIQINPTNYPDMPRPAPDDLHSTPNRYSSPVQNWRSIANLSTANPGAAGANRAGYQLLRTATYANPWQGQAVTNTLSSAIPNTYTGKNVDVIVGDDGCWFGHVEFQKNATPSGPSDYVGGNKLPGSGTCDLMDLVLDAPIYIDYQYFINTAQTTTRWDGALVPTENAARAWWNDPSKRSPQFASAGAVYVPSYYTRVNCNGAQNYQSSEGNHGTACAGQTYGRTYGWAYNANKWFVNAYGNYGLWPVDNYFDIIKVFHQVKPVNPTYGTKDPTICSNSWGFRESIPSSGYYWFRQPTNGSAGVQYASKPAFMAYLGSTGDGNRAKGEMLTNNLTTAGDELIASGVIFVAAAGNSNQKQVGSNHPDYNNYWATSNYTPLSSAYHLALDGVSYCYNTTSRRGFPQQLGQYTDGSGNIVYPVINIGALDDDYTAGGLERKVNYSDMGTEIDVYAPGDGTLTSNRDYTPAYARYDTYSAFPNPIASYDCRFSGTSSACPTATGLLATILENNRSWTWQNVRTWLQNLNAQSVSTFYQGSDPSTATDPNWSDLNSLMGGVRRVLYNNTSPLSATVTLGGSGLTFKGSGLTIKLS